jgi:hypothetical protein
MSDAFIAMWRQDQVKLERERFREGDTLCHAAGSRFRSLGIKPGDRVYVFSTTRGDGELLLLGRLTVEQIIGKREAQLRFNSPVYDAPEHLIGTGTPLRLDRVVHEDIARRLRRESGKPIKIAADRYRVDPQTLRTPGLLTDESAALLDDIL